MAKAPEELADILDDLERALKLITDKAPGYVKAQEYYDGTRAEIVAGNSAVAKAIEKSAQAHPISLAHVPVDVVMDKIELVSIKAKDTGQDSKLTEVMDANNLDDEIDDWHLKAGYFGDYYGIIDPQSINDEGTAADDIIVTGSSPLTTIVMYSRKNQRTPEYGVKRWMGAKKRWYANVYYDDVTVLLCTAAENGDTVPKAEAFGPLLLDDEQPGDERIEHPGGRMLVVHYAVDGKPYGAPIHRRAWAAQDALTKISATNLANVEGQGFMSRWALADPLAEIDDDIDDDFGDNATGTPANPDNMTTATTGTSRVRTMPGSIALLKGVKQVGEFSVTGSEDFLKNGEWYIRIMAVATGTPLFEFDLTGEQPSGESRRRAEGRSNKHARKVERALGSGHRTLGDTILACLGYDSAEVTATFRPTATEMDKDGLELVALKIKTGVPVTQAFLEAGYTDEQVAEWFPKGEPNVTPEMLTLLADALQKLGQAKTLTVITQAELADMLPTILTGAIAEGEPAPAPAA